MELSVFVSGLLTISLFLILHFIVMPVQERRRTKIEQLTKLYAPLYGLIMARLEVGKEIIPDRLTLGSIKDHNFLTKESLDKFIYDNLGYGSMELIEVWAKYTSSNTIGHGLQEELVKTVVKDFNRLRKDLKIRHNPEELKTGIPESIKQFRTNE